MSCVVIPLTKGYITVIDKRDARRVNKYKWHVHFAKGARKKGSIPKPYARATINGKKIYLHRFLTECYHPLQVDHVNKQTLDNRRENLEMVTNLENQSRRAKHIC